MKTLQKGFTLVELAIVLVIVSLLVAGIMGSQKMIEAARLTAVMADVNRFAEAVGTFEERYGALPGDLSDVSVLPALTPAPKAGNGDGVVSAGDESLQFWYHLMAAELVQGAFDGASLYVPAVAGKKGGIPSSKIAQSGYVALSDRTRGLMLVFGGVGGNSFTLPVLSPIDAYRIDKRMDDGNPDTGNVQAENGDGATSNCKVAGAYAMGTDTAVCILRFIIAPKPQITAPKVTIQCNGSTAGTARVSSTEACPFGYTGNVVESCMAEGGATGSWHNIQRRCNIVSCGEGSVVGDERQVSCPSGYTGAITQTCLPSGIWGKMRFNCAAPSLDGTCIEGDIRYFPCPLGQSGVASQKCQASKWVWRTPPAQACFESKCAGGVAIGEIGQTAACPSGYGKGGVNMACTLAGELKAVSNSCMPAYSTCAGGSVRELACAPGSMGVHWQKCNGAGVWETDNSPGKGNNCVPATCGGYPVGTARSVSYLSCPVGKVGVVMEICNADGRWEVTMNNCNQLQCLYESHNTTKTNWNTVNAGSKNINASSCFSGYGTTFRAARDCNEQGKWGQIRGSCTLNCTPSIAGNASWVETETGAIATIQENGNKCIDGYVMAQPFTRQCIGDGAGWAAPTGTCVPGVSVLGVDFW